MEENIYHSTQCHILADCNIKISCILSDSSLQFTQLSTRKSSYRNPCTWGL